MKRFALTLDLKDDEKLIHEYEIWHKNVWSEVLESINKSGINHMQLYRMHTRLFMLIDAEESFSFEKKNQMDLNNPKVQEWENLMWKYQQKIPSSKPNEKWVLMNKIFEL